MSGSAQGQAAKRQRLHAAASARAAAEAQQAALERAALRPSASQASAAHHQPAAAATRSGGGGGDEDGALLDFAALERDQAPALRPLGPDAGALPAHQPRGCCVLAQQRAGPALPPGVRFYAHAQMQAWRPLAQLVGYGAAVAALNDMVEKRRGAREQYAAMRLPRALALCGHAGSGRRTLVRAYARAAGLNLVELCEHGGTLVAADVEAAYAAAAAAPPCLVLVHGCDAALLAGIGPYAVLAAPPTTTTTTTGGGGAGAAGTAQPWTQTLLQRTLGARLEAAEREAGGGGVWSVLALERPYTELPAPLSARCYRSFWLAPASYTPAEHAMPRDNFAARRALLSLMVRERAPGVDTPETCQFFVSTHDIIVTASVNTTPRQLAAFLDRVFEAPLLRLSVAQINSSPAAALLPTQHDVRAALRIEGDDLFFITPTMPERAVVEPFASLRHVA